jgi:hypothetical protein
MLKMSRLSASFGRVWSPAGARRYGGGPSRDALRGVHTRASRKNPCALAIFARSLHSCLLTHDAQTLMEVG